MFFIQEGIVDIVTKSGEVATSLSDGSYFGGMFVIIKHSNMTSCTETSFSSMHTHLSDNNCTAVSSGVHILWLGFSSNVVIYISLNTKYL